MSKRPIEPLTMHVGHVIAFLQDMDAAYDELDEQNKTLRNDRDNAHMHEHNAQGEIASLTEQLEITRANVQRLVIERDQAKSQAVGLTKEFTSLSARVSAQSVSIMELTSQLDAARDLCADLRKYRATSVTFKLFPWEPQPTTCGPAPAPGGTLWQHCVKPFEHNQWCDCPRKPNTEPAFCEDEGCPHHGTKHICINS